MKYKIIKPEFDTSEIDIGKNNKEEAGDENE